MTTLTAADRPDSPGVRLYPPIVLAFCLAGGIAAEFALRPQAPLLPHDVAVWSGAAVTTVGLLFAGWGRLAFRRRGIDVKTNRPAASMVTGSVYRISRNPMYVGMIAVLAGIGLAAGSLPVLLSAVPMFLYLDWFVIAREERYLSRTFGAEYETYCRKVRRWL